MPIYQYLCPKCGVFEEWMSIHAPDLTRCPKCGKSVEKQLGTASLQFKGKGFYINDYGKGKGSGAS
jgi:putative FmdB family regulatory protein